MVDGIAGPEPVEDDVHGDTRSDQHRLAERNARIYRHDARFAWITPPGEQAGSEAPCITFDAREPSFQDLAHRDLASLRGSNEFPVSLDKQMNAICTEFLLDQWALLVQLLANEVEGSSDLLQQDLVVLANCGKDAAFDEIPERQAERLLAGGADDGMGPTLARLGRVALAEQPGPKRVWHDA